MVGGVERRRVAKRKPRRPACCSLALAGNCYSTTSLLTIFRCWKKVIRITWVINSRILYLSLLILCINIGSYAIRTYLQVSV